MLFILKFIVWGRFNFLFYVETLLWRNKPTRWKLDDSDDWSSGTLYQLVMANGQVISLSFLIYIPKIDVLRFSFMEVE